ncbi:MAG: DUF86 domain-containing protein [Waddliaceae bacterium]
MNDIIRNKIASIERCLKRIKEEYVGHEEMLEHDFTRQDSIILNIQRACEAAIDLGTQAVRLKNLGIPQTSRDVFILLESNGILPKQLSKNMQAMVGFRNIAVHDYQELNLDIVKAVIATHLNDFQALIKEIQKVFRSREVQ